MYVQIRIGAFVRIAVVLFQMLACAMVVWACIDQSMLFAAAGMAAMSIAVFPFLLIRRYDLFCPWSFVMLAIFTGCTLQCLCISWNWPSEEYIDATLLLGKTPEYFFYPSMIYLLSVVLLTAGFFLPIRFRIPNPGFHREFDSRRVAVVLAICLVLASAATAAYIRFTGGLSSGRISDKRATISTLDVGSDEELQQYGPLRQVTKLAPIAFLVLYSFLLSRYRRLYPMHWLILGGVFLVAFAMPFYSSSRSDVVWLFIGAIGVAYYHRQQHLFRNFAILSTVGICIFVLMSFLRNADSTDAMENASLTEAVKSLVLNRNGPGLAKTGQIINHIPDPLPYQFGKTIVIWAIAPIPRAIFPNKPLIHTGPIIGTEVFGTKTSGVPPGLIAEMYWNFHFAGVLFGMFAVGLFLRSLYERVWSANSDRAVLVPLYLFSLTEIGYGVLGHSLGYGVFMKLFDFATVATVLYFCTTRIRSQRQASTP